MTRKLQHLISLVLTLLILAAVFAPAAMAEDDAVAAVRAQLEAIDSLQTMQSKRGNYQSSKVYIPKKPADDPTTSRRSRIMSSCGQPMKHILPICLRRARRRSRRMTR